MLYFFEFLFVCLFLMYPSGGPTRLPLGKSVTLRCAHRTTHGQEQLRIKAETRMCSPSYPAPGWMKIKVSLHGSEGGENERGQLAHGFKQI